MRITQDIRQKIAFALVSRSLQAIGKMTFFHGTNYKNLKSIAQQGLVANSGAVWSGASTLLRHGQKAVYLTSDFERAARYGKGAEGTFTPAILEVQISTPKRFRKLRYDPLDRHATSWDIEDSYNTEEELVVGDLESKTREVAKQLGFNFYPSFSVAEFESLDGRNVIKWVLGSLLAEFPLTKLQRQQALRLIQQKFAGVTWDYLEVHRDGTLKLTEEYFYSREQLMFMKGLPTSTIKGVWVRERDFEVDSTQILDSRTGGFRELPGEAASRVEILIHLLGDLRWESPTKVDLDSYISQVREFDYPELLEYLLKVSRMDAEDMPDKDEWDAELESLEMGLQDDWGIDRVLNTDAWVKVPLRKAISLSAT